MVVDRRPLIQADQWFGAAGYPRKRNDSRSAGQPGSLPLFLTDLAKASVPAPGCARGIGNHIARPLRQNRWIPYPGFGP